MDYLPLFERFSDCKQFVALFVALCVNRPRLPVAQYGKDKEYISNEKSHGVQKIVMMSNLEFQTKTYISYLAFKCLSICEEILDDSSDNVKGKE